MLTGLSAVRMAKRIDSENAYVQKLMDDAIRTFKVRVTIKIARRLLLNSPFISNGKHMEAFAKSIGCGVYEVTFKEKEA
jgi:hypothetical protein